MKLFDRLKSKLGRGGSVDEVVQSEDTEFLPATRAYVRAIRRSQRLKGPGYTRSYRKGRKQRVREEA